MPRSATDQLHSRGAYLDDLLDGVMAGQIPPGVDPDRVYYVCKQGNDSDGKTWDTAFTTIDAAVDAYNARIDWSAAQTRYGCIFIAPGVYAETPSRPYYCWMIGTGIQGTDTATEIHPTTGSCLEGTLLGVRIINIWFETNEAVDCLNIGICNNSEIAYCTFTNGAAVAATALSTDNCTHLDFHHNRIETGQTTGMAHGLYFQGGADKYAHNVHIHDNSIFTTNTGVYIASNCTASEARIYHNHIRVTGGSGIGIDDNHGGSFCTENFVSAVDAIEHAGGAAMTVGNHVVNNGTGAMEASGS